MVKACLYLVFSFIFECVHNNKEEKGRGNKVSVDLLEREREREGYFEGGCVKQKGKRKSDDKKKRGGGQAMI